MGGGVGGEDGGFFSLNYVVKNVTMRSLLLKLFKFLT